jgi:hypothetical protein
MKVGKKFWFMWKDKNKTTLILQVLYAIKFKKIFKDPKSKMFEKDKFWLDSKYIDNDEELIEGFYSILLHNGFKGRILNLSGKILTQVVHNNLLFLNTNRRKYESR